jgi:hypothetical protein
VTQSTNARPCNCDQALEAERDLKRARALVREMRPHIPQDTRPHSLFRRSGALIAGNSDDFCSFGWTCRDTNCAQHQGQKLDAITRILCDLVSAPSLSVAQFADPTLERIRLAMLGRTG